MTYRPNTRCSEHLLRLLLGSISLEPSDTVSQYFRVVRAIYGL